MVPNNDFELGKLLVDLKINHTPLQNFLRSSIAIQSV